MTVTDQIKILDDKNKSNQPQYDLGREAAKISALSSKDLLKRYEHLTGEDLGHNPIEFEKAKFEYSPLGMSLKKTFEKDKAKSVAKSDSDFNYDSMHRCYKFYKGCDEFKEMSLDPKYNKIKKLNKLFTTFQDLRPQKLKTHFKKE